MLAITCHHFYKFKKWHQMGWPNELKYISRVLVDRGIRTHAFEPWSSHTNDLQIDPSHLITRNSRPDRWVECPSPVLWDWEIWTLWVWTLVEWNQWLKNWNLLLPSQALQIIRIGQWLVGSVSGYCHWVGDQFMVLVAWSPSGAVL